MTRRTQAPTLPAALDSERLLLATMMTSARAVEVAVDEHGLRVDHFHGPAHRHVFAALLALFERGDDVGPLSVAHELGLEVLEQCGGAGWLTSLMVDAGSLSSIPRHARIVQAKHALRLGRYATVEIGGKIDAEVDRAELADAFRQAADQIDDDTADDEAGEWRVDDLLAVAGREIDWVIEGGVAVGEVVMVTGASGSGKSLWSLQLGLQVAAGVHPFRPQEIALPQRVLYVQAENDPAEEGRRLQGMIQLAERWGPVRENFLALIPDGEWAGLNLGTPQGIAFLRRKVRKWQPRLVVLGPWKDVHGGLNSQGDGGEAAFVKVKQQLDHMRRKYGFALWIEAHATTDAPGSQNADHYRPRGTEAQRNWAHYGLCLIPMLDEDDAAIPGSFRVGAWRGGRSRSRWFPRELREGTPGVSWPWMPAGEGAGGRVAQAWGAA